ncbi:hypothetical protein [Rhodopirellula baltica]|uniref:Uncharacterized protein n=1 Tax=Rhodopirellula baltica SWK14 TaxID=993516 RepID=L7CJU7_RHOBT|nr:hypothetical protein [Rhodopirellula baltica]ELP34514.1 hypothetical protein RBSWK_01524 [Rhodopirellula baltica SWK14]
MSDMKPITDDNREPAVSAICHIAVELTELSNALFGYVNGTGDGVDRYREIAASGRRNRPPVRPLVFRVPPF